MIHDLYRYERFLIYQKQKEKIDCPIWNFDTFIYFSKIENEKHIVSSLQLRLNSTFLFLLKSKTHNVYALRSDNIGTFIERKWYSSQIICFDFSFKMTQSISTKHFSTFQIRPDCSNSLMRTLRLLTSH